jgi:hypothetical protein
VEVVLATKQLRNKYFIENSVNLSVEKVKDCDGAEPYIDTET